MHKPESRRGDQFDAVLLHPEGWVVLSPWVTTPEGHPFRLHITVAPASHDSACREWCEHIAGQLNARRPIEGTVTEAGDA